MPQFIPASVASWLVSLIVAVVPAPDELEVQLKGEGVRIGQADPSTNEAVLRLRVGEPDAYVTFGINWQEIALVHYKTIVWTPKDFGALRNELAETQRQRYAEPTELGRDMPSDGPVPSSVRPLWQAPARSAPNETTSWRVQFIELDAVAANWDRDPQWDGLVVRVWPMDQWGRVIRAPGTLTVALSGEASRGSSTYTCLGRWVRAVHAADYRGDGASFRLEFQNYDPERSDAASHPDHWIAPFGIVYASLAIPGHGVFQASTETPVRIRRFNPLRDRLILRAGKYVPPIEP